MNVKPHSRYDPNICVDNSYYYNDYNYSDNLISMSQVFHGIFVVAQIPFFYSMVIHVSVNILELEVSLVKPHACVFEFVA